MDTLYDLLVYKRAALEQLLVVATIFGAFSVGGLVALLAEPTRGRLRTYLFVTMCLASLSFIFATALDAVMMPALHKSQNALDAQQIRGLLDLGELPIWGVLVGTASLIASIAGFGFVYSRRVGLSVMALALATAASIAWALLHLAALLR